MMVTAAVTNDGDRIHPAHMGRDFT
jgi:hypothetical protein